LAGALSLLKKRVLNRFATLLNTAMFSKKEIKNVYSDD
jgi:hypothetical protein